MATKWIRPATLLTIICLFLITFVGAAESISTIRPGNTVFIGEQGLDITAAMDGDTILGWWASGAAISSASPDHTVSVSNPASFSVDDGVFGTQTGNWYHMSSLSKANGTAFTVADPYLDISVEDTTVGVDVTNKWVPTDDELRFRINTNLVQITQRTDVTGVPVTINVQTPDGAILSSLISKEGISTSIIDYNVVSTPQYTPSIWGTSNRATYLPGTYYVWAECNVNSMKDNYAQTGKTLSSKVSLLNQDKNPLIGDKSYVTNPTTPATTVTTIIPTTVTATATPLTITTKPITPPAPTITSLVETLPAVTTMPEPTAIPTKSPGFETTLAIVAVISGFAICIIRK